MRRNGGGLQSVACRVGLVLCILLLFVGSSMGELASAPDKAPDSHIVVYFNQSKCIETPWPVKRVSVTEPKVADVQVLTPSQVLLQGKAVGSTDLIMWSEKEEMQRVRVDVDVDLCRLTDELTKLFPLAKIELAQSQGVVIVRGLLRRAEHTTELHKFLDSSGLKYIDATSVAGGHQVLINVRVAEVSRTSLRTLGINIFHTGDRWFGASTIGPAAGGALNPISIGPADAAVATSGVPFTFNADVDVSTSVTLFGGIRTADIEMFIQALSENQYLRILAEPTLVAMSGEEASFLAGGEFPIPVVQGTGTAGTSISVEYREYGIRLTFRPTVLGDGTIRLYVAPEVSELTDTGAVEIQGFSIPAVLTRKAATTLEMKSGQTFAMAGLIDQSISARTSRVPQAGNLPVIGALFRSVRYRKDETELVVLVTASLVEPLSLVGSPPVPGVMHVTPNDWELFAEGRISGKEPAKISPAHAAWLKKMGLDRLIGPGGWAGYDQEEVQERPTMKSLPEMELGGEEEGSTQPQVE